MGKRFPVMAEIYQLFFIHSPVPSNAQYTHTHIHTHAHTHTHTHTHTYIHTNTYTQTHKLEEREHRVVSGIRYPGIRYQVSGIRDYPCPLTLSAKLRSALAATSANAFGSTHTVPATRSVPPSGCSNEKRKGNRCKSVQAAALRTSVCCTRLNLSLCIC